MSSWTYKPIITVHFQPPPPTPTLAQRHNIVILIGIGRIYTTRSKVNRPKNNNQHFDFSAKNKIKDYFPYVHLVTYNLSGCQIRVLSIAPFFLPSRIVGYHANPIFCYLNLAYGLLYNYISIILLTLSIIIWTEYLSEYFSKLL